MCVVYSLSDEAALDKVSVAVQIMNIIIVMHS